MPICNNCNKVTHPPANFCQHCGANNWKTLAQEAFEAVADLINDVLGLIVALLGFALLIGILLGGLWLLVALVKFMWEHS